MEDKVDNTSHSPSQASTQTVSTMDDSPLISIEKGACHGTCPIYKMTIYNNGHCEFKGKRFCKKLGAFAATISALELDLLQQKIAMLDMENYQEQYQSMIPDFPSTEITSYTKDASKSVWWRDGAPSELDEMAVVLDKFRQDLNWEVDINAPLPAGTIENQMLISLKDEVKAKDFAIEYLRGAGGHGRGLINDLKLEWHKVRNGNVLTYWLLSATNRMGLVNT